MTIIAACVITLKKPPTYRLAKDGTMPVWSAFGVSGNDAIQITAFRELAEQINFGMLGEGDAISVTGTLSLSTWEDKGGVERSGLKLIASKAEPVTPPAPKQRRASSPRRSNASAPPTPPTAAHDDFDDYGRFQA